MLLALSSGSRSRLLVVPSWNLNRWCENRSKGHFRDRGCMPTRGLKGAGIALCCQPPSSDTSPASGLAFLGLLHREITVEDRCHFPQPCESALPKQTLKVQPTSGRPLRTPERNLWPQRSAGLFEARLAAPSMSARRCRRVPSSSSSGQADSPECAAAGSSSFRGGSPRLFLPQRQEIAASEISSQRSTHKTSV